MASTGIDLSTAVWRKSSYSNGTGGECVEVADLPWRKSSYSNGSGGECIEVSDAHPRLVIPVRDSKKAQDGPVLLFRPVAWSAFLGSLKG
ncbi:DUF397 domain-containing protein [Streptomyces camelliae]|uniref:DUF397 domain-containing protein n=1 Tax=Streptomyces camelliae TaxID=3004093 RepID=A0ABY7P513_9ACTN|nr:DUF397 domain-containing protein [Streptomyces sp. HUAS 2-6]WBO65633.1 DUF397 domain-containing protein [Streptomyces sp. HUAS 2-6]